ncbi:hypothetical protein CALVIDRAFT_540236 [Calocera viscosa TUFC12733]|uniref:Peroxisomal biogenesis factor 11 n=1 Tax=Calocera viscosa (strain TUFC12733) TaxID=1330018 RepID=A0A167J559_CALVF|nr:hypothetical protein CALVIDRAFT_540236 [Calocera viscosa TUFC12733]
MAPSILQKVLRAPPPVLLSLLQSFSDDVYALSLLRIMPQGVGRRANRLANWCWFFSTLAQLVENGAERAIVRQLVKEVQEKIYEGELEGRDLEKEGCGDVEEGEREVERLKKQLAWIDRGRMKLVMDLIYVSYEVFNFKQYRQPVLATTGLIAGVLSTTKLYAEHKQQLLKSAADAV